MGVNDLCNGTQLTVKVLMYTIVDGVVVHRREVGGALRGMPMAQPGSAGRALRFE